MKWALAFLAVVGLAGCGAAFNSSATIGWSGNGNPGVPACGATHVNCIANVTVHDKTTGNLAVAAPTSPGSVMMPNAQDSFEIEANGYDGNGNLLSSGYVAVPTKEQP